MLKWPFTQHLVQDAPEWPGAYILWNGRVPVAVGAALGDADTIRSRLVTHLIHFKQLGIPMPSHYSWEITGEPVSRKAQLERELRMDNIAALAPEPERRASANAGKQASQSMQRESRSSASD